MFSNFSKWIKLQEAEIMPLPGTVDQARQPHLVNAGLGDGSIKKKRDLNNPMRRVSNPTSAFPTYGGDPLPGNTKAMKK